MRQHNEGHTTTCQSSSASCTTPITSTANAAAQTTPASGTTQPIDTSEASTTDNWQQVDSWINQNLPSSPCSIPSGGAYHQVQEDTGYETYLDFKTTIQPMYGAYYSSAEAPLGNWLSVSEDAGTFVSAGFESGAFADLSLYASTFDGQCPQQESSAL